MTPPEPSAAAAGQGDAPPPGREALPPRPKISDLLQSIAEQAGGARISIGDLVQILEARAFGALMLVFAFPNILPSPPGLAGVLGLPLVFLSAQLMLGRAPWLPGFIARRSMSREVFVRFVGRAEPWLKRAERMLTPRLHGLVGPVAQRGTGALCLILSLTLMLPIPLGNLLPSLAISVLALGILERDGVWILAGVFWTGVALTVVGGIAYALVVSAAYVLMNAL